MHYLNLKRCDRCRSANCHKIFCYLNFSFTFSIFCVSIAQYLRQRCGQRWFLGNHKNVLHLSLPFSGSFYLSLSLTNTLPLFNFTFRQIHFEPIPFDSTISSVRLSVVCLSNRLTQSHDTETFNAILFISRTHTKHAHKTRTCQRKNMTYLKRHKTFRLCSFSIQHCFGICRNCIRRERNLLENKGIAWIKKKEICAKNDQNVGAKFKGYGAEDGNGVCLWR